MSSIRLMIFSLLLFVGISSCVQVEPSVLKLKVRSIDPQATFVGCGVIAWAFVLKFEIVESNWAKLKAGDHTLLVQPCPDFLGDNFFDHSAIYDLTARKEIGSDSIYLVINTFGKEKSDLFWIENIVKK